MSILNLNVKKLKVSIWTLALGYFAFYVPYSAMTKALSRGLLPGTSVSVSGFEMLPAVVIGTFFMLLILLYVMGWHKYASYRQIFGFKIPFASNRYTFFSGIATAFIIMTTTLAYSFTGISIVFAALLMRGGVLLIAPVVDTVFGRKVHWYSWAALGLSLMALLLLFSEKGGYALTLIAGLNIAFYLLGYVFRLQFMTRIAKDNERETNYRFFVEEMLVAMVAIVVIPAFLALIGYGTIMQDLQYGFSTFLTSAMAIPALTIGALYACLYIFGSRIYLSKRENTFCIPINRCASLLAGVAASLLLTFFIGESFVSTIQLLSAGLLIIAILFLSYPEFQERIGSNKVNALFLPKKVYLFVCPGNTGRSPMAQAICQEKIKSMLEKRTLDMNQSGIQIISAGIDPKVGAPMSEGAIAALKEIGIIAPIHISSKLNRKMVKSASKIFCMSEEHRKTIAQKFPSAILKTHCIDPDDALPAPHGKDFDIYKHCAERLNVLITQAFANQTITLT